MSTPRRVRKDFPPRQSEPPAINITVNLGVDDEPEHHPVTEKIMDATEHLWALIVVAVFLVCCCVGPVLGGMKH